MTNFENKIVLITGGTSGIGKETARKFIENKAKVIITGRYRDTLDRTVEELGPDCRGIVSDAGNTRDLKNLRKELQNLTNSVDILFVNAGYGKFASVETADEAHFDELFNLLVKGPFMTVQQVLPLMKPGSSIVMTTSSVTEVGMANFSVYSAAKSAVQSFVKSFAAEFLEKKIRVNGVSPGYIVTNSFEKTGMSPEQIENTIAAIIPTLPLKRFGKAGEVADVVSFLASDEASYINGTEIFVDGGWTVIKN